MWNSYSEELKSKIVFQIVDDCSLIEPAEPILKFQDISTLNLNLYHVKDPNYAKHHALRACPHPWVPLDITQLSIIQHRFMPLITILQGRSTKLSIIQHRFMPLITILQGRSTKLSIIHSWFMLLIFTPQRFPELPINIYLQLISLQTQSTQLSP